MREESVDSSSSNIGGGQLVDELRIKILEDDEKGGEMKRRIGEFLDGLKVRFLWVLLMQ